MSEIIINGYTLYGPLSNANAGFSKWGFAHKNDSDFFIKELISPVYPSTDAPFDNDTKKKIIANCEAFEKRQIHLFEEINKLSDGNLIRILDFFRFGCRYYIVTKKINTGGISISDISLMEEISKTQICLSLSHTIMNLHSAGIVHGDIKATNVLFEKTIQGYVAAKVIDVDTCFFEGKAANSQVGDPVYYSPERAKVVLDQLEPEVLNAKVDVFSLGLLFHEIFTGGLPWFDEEYTYAFEACLDNVDLIVSDTIPPDIRDVIVEMLAIDSQDRISMQEVFSRIKRFFVSETPAEKLHGSPSKGSGAEDKSASKPKPLSKLRFGPGVGNNAQKDNNSEKPNDFIGLNRLGDLL